MTQIPLFPNYDRRRAWIESRSCSELSRAEIERVCGKNCNDTLIRWCERHEVSYRLRTIQRGFQPKQVPAVYGRHVAEHFGNYAWADGFEAEFVGVKVAA